MLGLCAVSFTSYNGCNRAIQPQSRVAMGNSGSFKKGKSGNPGGQSAEQVKLRQTIQKLAGRYAPEAIETLRALLNSEEANVRVSAANALLDRAIGKPVQGVELAGEGGGPLIAKIVDG